MPYRAFEDQNCSVAGALAILGGRWTLLVMREALLGRRRFADIRRNVGVAPNILSDRLQMLVDHGLLERRQYSEHPESFEYVPTPAGPPMVVVHSACGHDAQPELRCTHCGEVIKPGEVLVRPGPGANERQQAEPLLPVPGSVLWSGGPV